MWVTIPAYREESLIAASCEQWLNAEGVEHVLIYISNEPWQHLNPLPEYPDMTIKSDRTEEIIRTYFPEVEVVVHDLQTETLVRMQMLEKAKLAGTDYIVIADVDEFYTKMDWHHIYAKTFSDPEFGVRCLMKTYYWDYLSRYEPIDSWTPIVIVKPGKATFANRAPTPGLEKFVLAENYMHHLSWLGPAERIRDKIVGHAHIGIINEEWRQYHLELKGRWLWDVNQWMYPGYHKTLVQDPVPAEIVNNITRWQQKLGFYNEK